MLISRNEIFNLPFKLYIKNDKFNKRLFQTLIHKIRLNIDNEFVYDENIKNGNVNIRFINKNTSLDYQIDKNSFKFSSSKEKILYWTNRF